MNHQPKIFKSNGKLLLTAEYAVLDGAKALAIPTRYGQRLIVEPNETDFISWKSYNELGEVWFESRITYNEIATSNIKSETHRDVKIRLIQILKATKMLNSEFLSSNQGVSITTEQDFNRLWGLGTSSTLINNIADWASVDAYQLLEKTFGGSGYDIACAQHDHAISFQLQKPQEPLVASVAFQPNFKAHLYFVYLNQKQNSRDGISDYKKLGTINSEIINQINRITESMIVCKSLKEFESLMESHETIISTLIQQHPIKTRLFSDFNGAVKSLGAWGGDFILVASQDNPTDYFNAKGFETVIPYVDMVLES
ncbi:GYDIA family GHMP kinase [Winogradskyella bathintestinalis]|uniref:GYDIA family GHMP kinase n=1 Tax=Winogradskyella bathintestinalis TaxID=3035208 RepID=A0ABT7ZSL2_9FLAO|nr:GYDIA family GHMP kinase [Winogradskyella bathintestinalis]MDN3491991.1 GYDIA family GHMP kinase [Winogradskyella bathintestinalis]